MRLRGSLAAAVGLGLWLAPGMPTSISVAIALPAASPPELIELDLEPGTPVSFQRDVRPILSNHCFECHGPDEAVRQAGLRLDQREVAFAPLASGAVAVVPGDLEASRLFQRIAAASSEDRMPPATSSRPLSRAQIEILGRWILQGAKWEEHWSFLPPQRPRLPPVERQGWVRSPIDRFVLARLEREGIEPSPPARPATLARRLALDLTGLPPTPEEVDAFVADRAPEAVGRLIDRLLATERYGEHLARYWLDAARYADTNGYHIDNERFMWRWRDWVIGAFNRNLAFDRFTVEQLAGDLLPDPSFDQLLATGFNRNHMINFEGGAIPEEYQTQYVFDRVDTTSTVWMGLTAGCAKCHDHKFDPLSQREYYQLAAFFNTIAEVGLDGRDGNARPLIAAPTAAQRRELAPLEAALAPYEELLDRSDPELEAGERRWRDELEALLERKWRPFEAESATSLGGASLERLDDGSILVSGPSPENDVYELTGKAGLGRLAAVRLEALPHPSLPEAGPGRSERGAFVLSELEVSISPPGSTRPPDPVLFEHAFTDRRTDSRGPRLAIDGTPERGWSVEPEGDPEPRLAVFIATEPVVLEPGTRLRVRLRHESTVAERTLGRFRIAVTGSPAMELAELGPWSLAGPFGGEPGAATAAADLERRFAPEKRPRQGIDLDARYRDGRRKWAPLAVGEAPENGLKSDTVPLAPGVWYLEREISAPSARRLELAVSAPALRAWLNGDLVLERLPPADEETEAPEVGDLELPLVAGHNRLLLKIAHRDPESAVVIRRVDEELGELVRPLELNLSLEGEMRSEAEDAWFRRHYRRYHWLGWRPHEAEYARLRDALAAVEEEVPTTMVMAEASEPRSTHVLRRGRYDDPGERVAAATPAFLPPRLEGDGASRLDLARWLVDPRHPLTARVIANRIWQRFFGTGLVATSEDFGSQGEPASHPLLLDWLASELVRLDWDLKRFQKLILESATYAQSSRLRRELVERDPANRLLARASRLRLDAEVLRDSALYVSGLLIETVGGPSVRPYQPPGLWEEIGYESRGRFSAGSYAEDEGESLYRRSLYTFWKRTVPPPNMLIFDAPNRETCTVRRERTNTPLQALTLLNDPQFVEAARAFAERLLRGAAGTEARLELAYRLALSRRPDAEEISILSGLLVAERERLAADPAQAEALLEVGNHEADPGLPPVELAAWSTVASVVLNLDETLTRN